MAQIVPPRVRASPIRWLANLVRAIGAGRPEPITRPRPLVRTGRKSPPWGRLPLCTKKHIDPPPRVIYGPWMGDPDEDVETYRGKRAEALAEAERARLPAARHELKFIATAYERLVRFAQDRAAN